VRYYVERHGTSRIAMAGGVMANVKFNQRIAQLPGVEDVWVFPAMADAGTAFGAALCHVPPRPGQPRIEDVYLGPDYTHSEMAAALREAQLSPLPVDDLSASIAHLLTTGACVARFDGRMEFGPRALGNRSILVRATDPGTNDSLNQRLRRTEFMPFAPATLYEHAEACYLGIERGRSCAEFMTMTFDCTDKMRRESPAAVHVDGTARPQLVRKDKQPGYYGINEQYHRLTGIPTVINTSFNMHEEPIVCSPSDAVRAFLDGDLEFLALGPFLVANPRAPFTSAALERLAVAGARS
jgi:carbamoyltransferase